MVKILSRKIKTVEITILFLFIALYAWNISNYFWTLPAPSDPLQYLGPMVWKSTYAYWPWLDRISLAIGLRLFSMLIPTTYLAGPIYIGFINTLIIIISCFWLYRKQGFLAAVLICILFNTSFFLLGFATYIYPVQTEAFFALIAFILFFAEGNTRIYRNRIIYAGIFCAFTLFSKITGIFAVAYFGVYLLKAKDWSGLRDLITGMILGTLIVCLLFIALFNIQSFNNILSLFFKSNQWSGLDMNNLVSYLDQLLSVKFFPVFIALFIVVSAYKDAISRRLFCFAWANITVIYIIYTFTHRGGSVISPYIYPAYIFTGMGLASALGKIFAEAEVLLSKKVFYDAFLRIGVALVSFIFICAGLLIGVKYPTVSKFNYDYLYYRPLDIFTPGYIYLPEVCRWLFTLGPILILMLLLLSQISKSRKVIIFFMLTTSLWGAAFIGGLAYQKASFDRFRAGFFYDAAPVLNEVPDQQFNIFVKAWNEHPRSEYLLWVYRLFFDEKYPRGHNFDSQYKNDNLIRGSINYIKEKKDLVNIRGKQILTDDLCLMKEIFQEVDIVKEIEWKRIKLYVVDVCLPEQLFNLDLEGWDGPSIVSDTEVNNVAPLLKIGGIRGKFNFERIRGEENILKIIPVKPDKNGKLLIQLSLASEVVWRLSRNQKKNVILSLDVKMPSPSNRSEIFIQDKAVEWERDRTEIRNDSSWKRYRIYKRIRDNSTEFLMGVYWDPVQESETFEIKNIQINTTVPTFSR